MTYSIDIGTKRRYLFAKIVPFQKCPAHEGVWTVPARSWIVARRLKSTQHSAKIGV